METFANRYCDMHGKQVTGFSRRAVEALLRYDYPGNILELQNIVERAVILTSNGFPIDVSGLALGETKPRSGGLSLGTAGRLTIDFPLSDCA
jgi:DNA-binding NtrC family response regulator